MRLFVLICRQFLGDAAEFVTDAKTQTRTSRDEGGPKTLWVSNNNLEKHLATTDLIILLYTVQRY